MAILVLTKREPREFCSLCQRLDDLLADVPPGKLCGSCLHTIRDRYSDVMRAEELAEYQRALSQEWAAAMPKATAALAEAVLPPHIEYFPERKDGPIDL